MATKPTAPAAALPAFARPADRPDVHLPAHLRARPAARSTGSSGRGPSSHAELEIEREIADAVAVGEQDAARVRDDEIDGYGSNCQWAHNRHPEPTPSSDRPAPKRTTPVVGKRTELARYTVAEGERVLYGQRVDGVVRVTDRPATSGGRCYLVERGLQTKDELDALVADYVAEAQRADAPPLASCPVDRYLDAVA